MQTSRGTDVAQSAMQDFRNAIGMVDTKIKEARGELRGIREHVEFLESQPGSTAELAKLRQYVAYRAIELQNVAPLMEQLLDDARALAGKQAMETAAKPPVWQS